MSSTTVAEFASELKKPTDTLLDQLKAAGVAKSSASDVLTEGDKQKLLSHLQASHGTASPERKKITLVKKSTTEIKQADATGKARTIQVEVRKKRTFVKRDEDEATPVSVEPAAPAVQEPAAPVIDHAELARREEEARRQAELIRRQEEELAEKRRLREEQEAKEQAKAKAAKAAEAKASAKASEPEAKTVEAAEPVVDAKAQAAEAAREEAAAASKARADEDTARAVDLDARRRKALAEAEAIRQMMSSPQKTLVAKKPEPAPDAKAIKGTLHKPAGTPGTRPGAPAATGPGNKEVKSAKLSSSWADEQAKKKAIKTRGDASGGVGRNNWRGGPKGRRERDRDDDRAPQAPVEARVLEVHVPETITVGELAHKMAVKASEVIKQLMKLGQMATINQPLDQDTAMIVVEEMGHKAVIAALDDPEAFTEEEASGHQAEALTRAPVVTAVSYTHLPSPRDCS